MSDRNVHVGDTKMQRKIGGMKMEDYLVSMYYNIWFPLT